MKRTLIIGASSNPQRYAFMAAEKLTAYGHEIELLGLRPDVVAGKTIDTDRKQYADIDTVTLYVGPQHQESYYDYVIGLKPKRVIFNPGTENTEFQLLLKKNGIDYEEACTLVMLGTGQY
jgi:predicted CoA-binding protein